eukprot:TRINITY_DN8384_c0_g1_i1.p1 TRINITY_DN8384_c0_g1~~TRINITY_DN8384_c0_g1_i1.p1  ORF type:complete len:370 (-),score=81.75 TRINITY_DN8384_c0_g1_i1:207-1316(-)
MKNSRKTGNPPRYRRIKPETYRRMFENLGKKLGLKKIEDWYELSHQTLSKHLPSHRWLQSRYPSMLQKIFPEHKFELNKFVNLSIRFWDDKGNQKIAVEETGKQLEVKTMDDWYRVTKEKLLHYLPRTLLNKFNCSPSRLLQSVYPDHRFDVEKFENHPKGYWEDYNHRKNAVEEVAKQLGYSKLEDWYEMDLQQASQMIPSSLLAKNSSSVFKLLSKTFPEHNFRMWKFKTPPKQWWKNVEYRKEYMKWLFEKLEIKHMKDWYNVSRVKMIQLGGSSLLNNCTLCDLLRETFPEHEWEEDKFQRQITEISTIEDRRKLVARVEKEMKMKDVNDWYRISHVDLKRSFPLGVLRKFPLKMILSECYPSHY